MVGTAVQERAVDQRGEPGQDGFEKAANQILDKRRHIRQIASATAQHQWYTGHSNRLSVT